MKASCRGSSSDFKGSNSNRERGHIWWTAELKRVRVEELTAPMDFDDLFDCGCTF
jgi:hypothetical protein